MRDTPLLSVRDLKKHYPIGGGLFSRESGVARAVDGISFDIHPGETLGLVGESGCGKSTAARSIVRLEEPTDGEVIFNGGDRDPAVSDDDDTHPNDITRFGRRELNSFRREVQMIFQDPSSSFDPRMTAGDAVAEPLFVHGMADEEQRRTIVEDLLERVGLSAADRDKYPHELSGGQKQRLALARALVLNPELVIADEPVSALDVSIQAEVLSLIDDLQTEFDLSLLFISHDISVIRRVCDRVAVMYLGEIVEIGPVERIFADPQHPYTEVLLSSISVPDPRAERDRIELTGTVPDPSNPPDGCRFHTRCHEVVQPEDLDLEQSNWRGLLSFRDRVVLGDIDIEAIRESATTDSTRSKEESTQATSSDELVKNQLRAEFDLPAKLSDGQAEAALADALERLTTGDIEGAAEVLASTFVTPCEKTVPSFTDHGDGHRSACIRHHSGNPSADVAGSDG
jgi:peptide/nickel transport system ATP-binding protein